MRLTRREFIKKKYTQLSNYCCQYIACMSICGKFQPQDHGMSFSNRFILLRGKQATTAANNPVATFVSSVFTFSSINYNKPVGSDWALPICMSVHMSVYLDLCFHNYKKENPTCFTIAVALCSWKIFFCTHTPFSFVLFYDIDCLLAGSKVRQIKSSLQGGLTGTRK